MEQQQSSQQHSKQGGNVAACPDLAGVHRSSPVHAVKGSSLTTWRLRQCEALQGGSTQRACAPGHPRGRPRSSRTVRAIQPGPRCACVSCCQSLFLVVLCSDAAVQASKHCSRARLRSSHDAGLPRSCNGSCCDFGCFDTGSCTGGWVACSACRLPACCAGLATGAAAVHEVLQRRQRKLLWEQILSGLQLDAQVSTLSTVAPLWQRACNSCGASLHRAPSSRGTSACLLKQHWRSTERALHQYGMPAGERERQPGERAGQSCGVGLHVKPCSPGRATSCSWQQGNAPTRGCSQQCGSLQPSCGCAGAACRAAAPGLLGR